MGKRTKAFGYLRVSGTGQVKGHGFSRQRQTIRRYARANSIDLVSEFRDEGVSGTKELADRDGLAALLGALKANGVSLVLVERADRVARDLVVGEVILGQFREIGVKVIGAEGGTDLTASDDDPTRVLIRQVLGAVAQFEKSGIVLKLRVARERKRRVEGRCEGRKPYGAHPGERKALERIRELRRKPKGRKRMSVAKIAGQLNTEGYPTRMGGPWQPRTVYGILRRANIR